MPVPLNLTVFFPICYVSSRVFALYHKGWSCEWKCLWKNLKWIFSGQLYRCKYYLKTHYRQIPWFKSSSANNKSTISRKYLQQFSMKSCLGLMTSIGSTANRCPTQEWGQICRLQRRHLSTNRQPSNDRRYGSEMVGLISKTTFNKTAVGWIFEFAAQRTIYEHFITSAEYTWYITTTFTITCCDFWVW